MQKRGAELALNMIIIAALSLVVLFFGMTYLIRSGMVFGKTYNEIALKADARSCQAQGALAEVMFDRDFGAIGDKFPDNCDFCLGGDDGQDQDDDGIPDACDKEPCQASERGKKMSELCKGFDPAKNQCRLDCYRKPDMPCTPQRIECT